MGLTRMGRVFTAGIAALFTAVAAVSLLDVPADPLTRLVRTAALLGLLALGLAALTTPFLARIRKTFGRPFLTVHHLFAAGGLVLVTLHPVLYAVQVADITVFLPAFSSVSLFLALGGRFALILLYLAAATVLLRRSIPKYWRIVHGLMYPALLLGVVHGNLIGTDFAHPFIFFVYNILFVAVVAVFVTKRWQRGGKKRPRPPR
jgi:DMSO/TMAO reductase YedYZ heme-binding membrane subunit